MMAQILQEELLKGIDPEDTLDCFAGRKTFVTGVAWSFRKY